MKYSLTIISISLVISIIIGAFFLYPRYQEFVKLQNQADQKEEELENQQSYFKLLNEINKKVQGKKDLINKISSAIPDEPDIPSFLNFLREEAKNTGVGLEQVNWSESSSQKDEKKQTNQYLINLEISGSYFAFRNFLSTLESSARLIEVLTTDFSITPETEEPTIFSLRLKIHSY